MRILCKSQQAAIVSNSHFAILLWFYQTVNFDNDVTKLFMQLRIYGNVILIHEGSVCVWILFYNMPPCSWSNSEIDL